MKIKTFIRQNSWINRAYMDCGYVMIPKGHYLHGRDDNSLNDLLNVHGGITLAELASNLDWDEIQEENQGDWIIGFDTCHGGDTLEYWTKERIQEELDNLVEQIYNLEKEINNVKIHEE